MWQNFWYWSGGVDEEVKTLRVELPKGVKIQQGTGDRNLLQDMI
jgi:hypothetical protein